MLVLKHLKTLQLISIIIQIVFRELIYSLLVTEFKNILRMQIVECDDVAA